MTVVLPPPAAFEPPPGDPAALAELVQGVAGAVFCLGVLEAALAGPAGRAPGWHGDDAAAAGARVAVVSSLARDGAGALWVAAGRLSAHRERVLAARERIRALEVEQEEDVAAAWGRLGRLPDPATSARTGAPEVVALVEEFEAGEAARRREHAALLEEVADDAAATARVLAECSAVVGGTGRPGDEHRAVAHLALVLPAWGEAELTARGAALAGDLAGLMTAHRRAALAEEAAAYAAHPAFADALLAGLGVEGVRTLLADLGGGELPWDSALAALVASAFGAARPTGDRVDPVGDVLAAGYVDPAMAGTSADVIALGMGAVLAAGLAGRSGGPGPRTALAWGQQLLARERAWADSGPGGRALDRADAPSDVLDPVDPLLLVAETLARASEAGVAAEFLGVRDVWEQLLARSWADGAVGFGALVERAAADPGPAGAAAVRTGLEALGAGWADGDPDGWRVDEVTAAAVSPALGAALAAHVTVAVDALWVGVDGSRCLPAPDALRGLGYLTLHRGAAAEVERALHDWAVAQPGELSGTSAAAPLPAVAVPAAYLAAQEYGRQMGYVRDSFEAQEEAERRAFAWQMTVGLLGEIPGPAGRVAGLVEGFAAIALDRDGTWDQAPDPGPLFDDADAAEAARAALGPERVAAAEEVARQAAGAFVRAASALGEPVPAESPPTDWLAPVVDAFLPGLDDVTRALRRHDLPD